MRLFMEEFFEDIKYLRVRCYNYYFYYYLVCGVGCLFLEDIFRLEVNEKCF